MIKNIKRTRATAVALRHFSSMDEEPTQKAKMVTPRSKLHFIDHPRYGKVYPIVTFDFSRNYFALPVMSYLGLGCINSVVLYGTFINQIFTPVAQSFLCNPLFIVPSLYLNYALFERYYVYFFGARSHLQNMYLKPNGKEVIVETRDGESREIKTFQFFNPKRIRTRHEHRIDLGYGANNYLYIKGNSQTRDFEILEAVLMNYIVDVNNVAYDYDVSQEFTWEYRDLVEIKKRNRSVTKFVRPTPRNLLRIANARAWWRAKEAGAVRDKKEIVQNYSYYKYFKAVYNPHSGTELPGERGEILPGDPMYKKPITEEVIKQQNAQYEANTNNGGLLPRSRSSTGRKGGRRVQRA